MNYSKTHQNFSNYFHPEALTAPENFLGPNYETVINFWTFMDSLTEDNWKEVASRYLALDYATVNAARDAAWYAAGVAAGDVAGATAEVAPPPIATWCSAAYATLELIGMYTLLDQGREMVFVPMFSNL